MRCDGNRCAALEGDVGVAIACASITCGLTFAEFVCLEMMPKTNTIKV
jgi:hypothetical protein